MLHRGVPAAVICMMLATLCAFLEPKPPGIVLFLGLVDGQSGYDEHNCIRICCTSRWGVHGQLTEHE